MISLQEIRPLQERLTKRRHIYKSLQALIHSQKVPSGTPFPTTHELARRFTVSYATMQTALDDLVRDGWLVRHQGKGTFTADGRTDGKRSASSSMVAVLPVLQDIAASGHSTEVLQFLRGSAIGASACGGRVEILSLPSALKPTDIEAAVQAVLPHDGALFFGRQYLPLIRKLGQRKKVLVMIDSLAVPGAKVWYDREGATQIAVRHLIEHGFRRIAYFGSRQVEGGVKYSYFCQTLKQHSIKHDLQQVHDCNVPDDAYQAALRLLSRSPLPEAVFVDNYPKAKILVQVAQSRGLSVPKDFAVMAYGTEELGSALPLSFMAVPYEEMGRQASIILDQLIRGRARPPVQKILKAKLILRRSCGCRSAAGNA